MRWVNSFDISPEVIVLSAASELQQITVQCHCGQVMNVSDEASQVMKTLKNCHTCTVNLVYSYVRLK